MASDLPNQKLTKFDLLVRSKYEELGSQEKKIADYFLTNQNIILSASVEDISKCCNVSKATVVRFCKRLGFSGMKDFKIFYQLGNLTAEPLRHPVVWEDDDETIFHKVFVQATTTLEKTFQATPFQTLANIADCIIRASNIDVFGIGGSAIVASYFKTELIRLGKRVNAYTDIYTIEQISQSFREGDLAIFVSRSGENKPILELARKAKSAHATVVAVTNSVLSELDKIADFSAITEETQFFCNDRNSFSRLAQMSIVTTLYLMTAIRLGRESAEFRDNYFERTNYKKF
ncbi:MAG: MurR/RpiR family transcriptional regulator [Sphaerochaeta sp.]